MSKTDLDTATTLADDRGSPSEPGGRARPHPLRALTGHRTVQELISPAAFVILFLGYGVWLGSAFFQVDARILDIHTNVPILLLGLAVMVTLLAGQFDLSVASMATLTTFLTVGLNVKQGWPFALILVACLAVGLLGGLLNGLLVSGLGVNTFISTLGTSGLFLGLSQVYSGGGEITPGPENELPSWFTGADSFGNFTTKVPEAISVVALLVLAAVLVASIQRFRPPDWTLRRWIAVQVVAAAALVAVLVFALDLPTWIEDTTWPVALLLAVAFALWVLIRLTTFGRYVTATGANPLAARLAGVKTERETIKAFALGGLLAGLAGVVLAAAQATATPDVAGSFLLPAFAAAFLSTVMFSTGQFTVWGTVVGGISLLWVSQGLIVGGLPFTWTNVVNGVVLVSAVAVSSVLRRRR